MQISLAAYCIIPFEEKATDFQVETFAVGQGQTFMSNFAVTLLFQEESKKGRMRKLMNGYA